jgi:hypothetical protein
LALLMVWRRRPPWLLPALLGTMSLGIYLLTLLPSVGEADTLEFQVVAFNLGVAHPTGYPLYILLGKLFTLLPLRNVAWRVNLASAVFGAGAVVVLYGVVRRLVASERVDASGVRAASVDEAPRDGVGRSTALIGFLAAVALAVSPTFWSQALVAEIYTLHNLLAAGILGLLLRPAATVKGGDGSGMGRWYAVCFLLGLSLTNHLTTVLLVPAAVVAFLWDRPRWGLKDGLVGGGLFLLGLSLYLYIPLRWPALHDGQGMTLGAFLRYVSGGQFRGALRLAGWRDPARWRIVGRLLQEPFGWAGLALAAVGVVRLAVRQRRALALTGATLLGFLGYGLVYHVPDIAVFLLPAHLVLAVWAGLGAASLARLVTVWAPGWSRVGGAVVVLLFALIPLSGLWTTLPAVDRSRDGGACAWGRYVLDQPLRRGGAILADPKRFAPLYYLQQVEGWREDLDVVVLGSERLYQEELRRRLAEGQPVYLARYLPDLGGFYLRSIGPLVEVGGESPNPAAGSEQSLARFGDSIHLLRAEVERDPLGRPLHHLTLHWWAEAPLEGDHVVRLRLVDGDGRVRWSTEGARPVDGLYPTNAWRAEVPIADYHEIPIPAWLAPGTYRLEVGLFPPFGGEGLPVDGGGSPWLALTEPQVEPATDPELPGRPRRMSFEGGIWLTGDDVPTEGMAGSPFTVELAWRGVAEDEVVRLSWTDGEGKDDGGFRFPLAAGMVRSRHTVTAPAASGAHRLRVGLVGRSARCGWLRAPGSGCVLEEVDIAVAPEGLATFGDRVLLTDAKVEKATAVPGEVVPVALRWRGLRAMSEDYTVFVHLVGPDGRLHGQVDSWPVQGTYPTSAWRPGREVVDEYRVRLEADAPAGSYRVVVGLYQLETMERLRVVDEAGEPVADSVTVGTFEVGE